ncbi:Uncharacterised protein [Chlamydia abortus]|nr:Uncharacterised protein [Chlamydia abortus]
MVNNTNTIATDPAQIVCLFSTTAMNFCFLFLIAPPTDAMINANANTAIQSAIKSENVNKLSIL